MKTLLSILLLIAMPLPVSFADPQPSGGYVKQILGRWLGPKKYEIYYADGTWAVQKTEESKPDKTGRRWHINGNKLVLTFPGGSATETIVSFAKDKFVTENEGDVNERTRAPR